MQVNLSSGNYKIIADGEVFLFDHSEELNITLTEKNFNANVTLKFLQDSQDKARFEKNITGNNIILSCFNFKDSGTGLSAPWQIAIINGKKLFLTFWSYMHGTKISKVRSVKYTVFYEK